MHKRCALYSFYAFYSMHRVNSKILARIATALATLALRGDRKAARAVALLSATSRAARLAVRDALASVPAFRSFPASLAAHVAVTPLTIDAHANATCLLCGKPKRDVRAAARPLLVVHPTCVRKEHKAGTFVTAASLRRRNVDHSDALVLAARAIGWYQCVLSRPRRPFFASSALLGNPPN